jgi:hypothetical protein
MAGLGTPWLARTIVSFSSGPDRSEAAIARKSTEDAGQGTVHALARCYAVVISIDIDVD